MKIGKLTIPTRLDAKINQGLVAFNVRHSTSISKEDFIKILLSLGSERTTSLGLR